MLCGWWKTSKIELEAADEGFAISLGVPREFFFFQSGVDENVDRVSLLVFHRWANDRLKSPVPFPIGPPGYPLLE